eukprot:jgi/Botrbrau1/10849/Bobra.0025s0027.1
MEVIKTSKESQRRVWSRNWAHLVCLIYGIICLALLLSPKPSAVSPISVRRGLSTGSSSPTDADRRLSDDVGRTIGALLLSLGVGLFATAAGVGGGAFYVPLFNILLQFSVKGSMALSQAAIAGGALAGVLLYMFKHHPTDPTKHIIDFDLALMLTPSMLLGVAVGVLANTLFPSWLVTFLLIVLLVYLSYVTVRKALLLHRAEKAAAILSAKGIHAGSAAREEDKDEERTAGAAGGAPDTSHHSSHAVEWSRGLESGLPHIGSAECEDGSSRGRRISQQASFEVDQESGHAQQDTEIEPDHEEEPHEERLRFPYLQTVEILLLWGAFLALQLEKSRFPRCSVHYIAMFSSQAALLFACGFAFLVQAHLRYKEARGGTLRRPILPGMFQEVEWSMPRLIKTSLITLAGGILAGLLGIGGGMILSPLLLMLGVHPLVSAATSSVLVLFSASSAALSFGFDGTLNWQFALLFALTSFGVSLVGVLVVVGAVKRSGKASIVVILLAFIILTGALLTAAFAGRRAIVQLIHHEHLGFVSFCSTKPT